MTRILSIEDDPEMQHLIGEVLFKLGYEIHYSWNGRDGYEKMLMLRPDLVLLDLMLPIMNGVEVLEKMRGHVAVRHIPVIVLSAYGDESSSLERSIMALEVAHYIRKPFSVGDLVDRVKNTLAQSQRGGPPQGSRKKVQEILKGVVRLDVQFMTVWIKGRLVATLSPKNFALLKRLTESAGPVSQEELMRDLSYANRDMLKKAVQRLRKELGDSEAKRRIWTSPDGYELKRIDISQEQALAGDIQ